MASTNGQNAHVAAKPARVGTSAAHSPEYHAIARTGSVLVPGWWLDVAMLLGIFATYAGAHWMH